MLLKCIYLEKVTKVMKEFHSGFSKDTYKDFTYIFLLDFLVHRFISNY